MFDGLQGQAPVPLMRSLLSAMVKPYLVKNPTAVAALDLIRKHDGGPICYDHFAFRTFGVSPIMLSVVIVLMEHGNGAIHGNEWVFIGGITVWTDHVG